MHCRPRSTTLCKTDIKTLVVRWRETCLSIVHCGAQPNLRKAVILTASSDVMHIMFPAFLQHTDGHLMFKGDDMTTKQTAMQQSTVLLCCNPLEHDKVSQMIFPRCIFITFFFIMTCVSLCVFSSFKRMGRYNGVMAA